MGAWARAHAPMNSCPYTPFLERNIVFAEFGSDIDRLRMRGLGARGLALATASACTAAQQDDAVAANLGRVALVALLVVPLTRLEAAFDVNLLALLQVLIQRLRLLAPENDPVPLRLFLALAFLVVPGFRGG